MQRGPDDNSSRIYPIGTANARIMGVAKGNLSERSPRPCLEGSNPETEKLSEAQGTLLLTKAGSGEQFSKKHFTPERASGLRCLTRI